MKRAISNTPLALALLAALLLAAAAYAAAPGITGTGATGTFALTAQQAYLNQPDGAAVYSWGYGCATGTTPAFAATNSGMTFGGANCPTMQVPGPTLIVTEGQAVSVTLTNQLPTPAGNTSILFPDFVMTSTCAAPAVQGLLTCEAPPGGQVTYTFNTIGQAGTHAYYSGTQGDLQIEMGLYGAVIVLPASPPANCSSGYASQNTAAQNTWKEADWRNASPTTGAMNWAAYDHPGSCFDREYLFQWAEMDVNIHRQALAQVTALGACAAGAAGCGLKVPTEPYHPAYFVINGRSMPDLMDPNYDPIYPHQPYNGNPHMHPGEQTLVRAIGQGRWQHPFHEHGNHVRILGRDGNMVLGNSASTCAPGVVGCIPYSTPNSSVVYGPALAGLLMFNTDTTPGQAFDGIFYWSGRGLNWDAFGHNPASADPLATLPCNPDANGYNTGDTTAVNYFEWCQDHNKPVEANPFGDVNAGGPVTLPNPNIFTNGPWYGGTPYLGPDATIRSSSALRNDGNKTPGAMSGCETGVAGNTPNCTNLQPSNVQANPANERGYAFMWHSHNEREITTNNVFPGGMLMMMLVDSREFVIDESQ